MRLNELPRTAPAAAVQLWRLAVALEGQAARRSSSRSAQLNITCARQHGPHLKPDKVLAKATSVIDSGRGGYAVMQQDSVAWAACPVCAACMYTLASMPGLLFCHCLGLQRHRHRRPSARRCEGTCHLAYTAAAASASLWIKWSFCRPTAVKDSDQRGGWGGGGGCTCCCASRWRGGRGAACWWRARCGAGRGTSCRRW